MKVRDNGNGSTTVQAWRMTKGGDIKIVYEQGIALDWFGKGYDMQIVAITRTPGGAPKIEDGVVI